MNASRDRGIVDVPSRRSVDETVGRLEEILRSKGVTLFALVDHSGEAAKVGMEMRPTKLLIFGNPKAGTPLMLAVPRSAIDLPLKILVWEDAQRKVWVSYNSPAYLKERHGLPEELVQNIAVVEALAIAAAGEPARDVGLPRASAQPYFAGLSWTDSAARKGLMTRTVP
jgi:uncharacterized protein (DUF302 family)